MPALRRVAALPAQQRRREPFPIQEQNGGSAGFDGGDDAADHGVGQQRSGRESTEIDRVDDRRR